MNAFVGDKSSSGQRTATYTNTWANFFKMSDFHEPALTFVFADEHPDSINDSGLFNPEGPTAWTDEPANYHNGACGFAFGDGHSEIHKWRQSNNSPEARAVLYQDAPHAPVSSAKDRDIGWMVYHACRTQPFPPSTWPCFAN